VPQFVGNHRLQKRPPKVVRFLANKPYIKQASRAESANVLHPRDELSPNLNYSVRQQSGRVGAEERAFCCCLLGVGVASAHPDAQRLPPQGYRGTTVIMASGSRPQSSCLSSGFPRGLPGASYLSALRLELAIYCSVTLLAMGCCAGCLLCKEQAARLRNEELSARFACWQARQRRGALQNF